MSTTDNVSAQCLASGDPALKDSPGVSILELLDQAVTVPSPAADWSLRARGRM